MGAWRRRPLADLALMSPIVRTHGSYLNILLFNFQFHLLHNLHFFLFARRCVTVRGATEKYQLVYGWRIFARKRYALWVLNIELLKIFFFYFAV